MLLCFFVRSNWISFCLKCSRSREEFVEIICLNHYFISHIVHYQSSLISHNFILSITYVQASMLSFALKRDENKDHLILWSENSVTNDATQTQKDFKKWWRFTKYEINDLNATKKDKRRMCWESASRSNEVWKCYIETIFVSTKILDCCVDDVTLISCILRQWTSKAILSKITCLTSNVRKRREWSIRIWTFKQHCKR
jgi:hypothetical protein